VGAQDYAEAVKWLSRAAEQELADAQCQSRPVLPDRARCGTESAAAVKWFIKAARQGNQNGAAQSRLHYASTEAAEKAAIESRRNTPS